MHINMKKNKVIVIASPHSRNDLLRTNLQNKFPNREILRIRSPQELSFNSLERLEPEYVFFPHWSWIIPYNIFSRFECVIFHMTDLPYGRGGSPLQNLIVRGHLETKLTALKCVSELDAGPVYLKRPLSLMGTAEEILRRASDVIEEMIVEIINSQLNPTLQSGDVVEFKRRKPLDGSIAELVDLRNVFNYIRMLDADDYPHAFIDLNSLFIEFTNATLTDDYVEAKVKIRIKKDG
jgi:methionyl-tRNA formyltransferase